MFIYFTVLKNDSLHLAKFRRTKSRCTARKWRRRTTVRAFCNKTCSEKVYHDIFKIFRSYAKIPFQAAYPILSGAKSGLNSTFNAKFFLFKVVELFLFIKATQEKRLNVKKLRTMILDVNNIAQDMSGTFYVLKWP